ncbi:hypothetical protein HHK36_013870 [Tetracentron sinense]|uniref:RING-type domain-containing protein n=1 Tax=Tetracentron sinense TaxID=13715 RepID=A0A834Z7U0_TETSI|nr:hypothetical protein HHK36_013870 [Tetracentron sinense]
MGSSSSRLGSRPSRPRVNRTNRRLCSFICGGSNSHATVEMEDYPAELLGSSTEDCDLNIDVFQSSTKESSSILGSETKCSRSKTENGASSDSSNGTIEDTAIEFGSKSVETSKSGKYLSESKELVLHPVNADSSPVESYWERTSDIASTSSRERQSPELVSENVRASLDVVVEVDDSHKEGRSHICPDGICSSSTPPAELGNWSANGLSSIENQGNEIMDIHNSILSSVPVVSDSPATLQSLRNESAQEATPPGPGFLMPDGQRERRNGSVLLVDVVSISSNILSSSTVEISNREVRRNSRRMFWDAFSRRSSRRHSDSPTIVFSTDDADDLGSHDRWLLDFGGDLFEDGGRVDSGYLGSRSHGMHERRWQSRSEIWETLRLGLDESGWRTNVCSSGLHPHGTCSCESYLMTEESGTRGSISRIVMLAEALFEVLDEIHRQPVGLSLSMVSLPAPESVVNSFPLKNHNTADNGDDVEQCYICLADYEEGDKIRVLPCHHEYHMSCVDKWLKEIHRVCPLCRGDVLAGAVGVVASGDDPNSAGDEAGTVVWPRRWNIGGV